MDSDEEILNSMLQGIKAHGGGSSPSLIPIPSATAPTPPTPQYETNPYTGEKIPLNNHPPRPNIPMSVEPDPLTKIKLMGNLVASVYHQGKKIESDHDPSESYGSTDRGDRTALMKGLEKIAINLDKQAVNARNGQNVTLSNVNQTVIEPKIPQFVSETPNAPIKPTTLNDYANSQPIYDDRQMTFNFETKDDKLNHAISLLNTKMSNIEMLLNMLIKQVSNITLNTDIKKK